MNNSPHCTAQGLASDCSLGEWITDWAKAPIGLPVMLLNPYRPTVAGLIDDKTDDGSVIWVRDDTSQRRLIHRSDGYTIRAVVRWPSRTK